MFQSSMFQFSIRELLLITLSAALILGWGLDHRWQRAARKRAEGRQKVAETEARYNGAQLAKVHGELIYLKTKYEPVTENPALTLELPVPILDVY